MQQSAALIREFRAISPDRLLPIHERWLRDTWTPGVEVSALSLPRGNAKSATVGRLLALTMTPGSCLWRDGLETVVVAASLRQARITWGFMKAALGDLGEYRTQDSDQRIGITHKATGQVAFCISSSGKGAMGLSQFSTIYFDEPAALDVRNGALLYDAVRTSLGKIEGQRLVLAGTRAPAEPEGWWPNLLDGGSGPGVHVTTLSAPMSAPWDQWSTIRKVNPVAERHGPLRRTILRERDEALRNPTMRRPFEAFRLNRQIDTAEDVLIEASDWERVERREVQPRAGRPVVGLDLGSERSWSAAWCLWPNGRSECYAVCPGVPGLDERERQDAQPRGLYRRLEADGVLVVESGKRVSSPATLIALLEGRGIRPEVAYHDVHLKGELRDCVAGRFPLVDRVPLWKQSTEDIAAFRKLTKDGPLSIAPECRALARVSLSQAAVEVNKWGGASIIKKKHGRSRDDVAVAATLAAGHLVRQLRKPKPRRRRHGLV